VVQIAPQVGTNPGHPFAHHPHARAAALQRINAHAARERLPELMDRAHAGEAFLLKKHNRPWAQLQPLDAHGPAPAPQRQPGRLRRLGPLQEPRLLLNPRLALP
jgi:antitoxin (DNA-binding transcriptional repressor) of toxin-antitoxin stability system